MSSSRDMQIEEEIIKNVENKNTNTNTSSNRNIKILLIALLIVIVVAAAIAIPVVLIKSKDNNIAHIESINKNNYIKTEVYENYEIPSDGKLQVVGKEFSQKNSTLIIGTNNNKFIINNNGIIEGVTKKDFPLYYSFNETITNGSYLFKDVTCFKEIDLSKMDSSKMIDATKMFENSNFENIYFGINNESIMENSEDFEENEIIIEGSDDEENGYFSDEIFMITDENDFRHLSENSENNERKEYFDTTKIESAEGMFLNCQNLTKIQLPSSFNVGKNAKEMFKGCSKLEEVNTTFITSSEIEKMESMFEDCTSIREISFSNNFLTGEVKSLNNAFKNTNLNLLDLSHLRLYSLENSANVLDGASIQGTLKLGKYYKDENTRDNLLKEIAKVTDSETNVFTPQGTEVKEVFQDIYYTEKKETISVKEINVDYNIRYKENQKYKLYSKNLHIGLGWDYDSKNTYDLDSSVLTFDSFFNYLDRVNFQQLKAYGGAIDLNGDDITGMGGGDDEEIRILLDRLPSNVKIVTVQLNSFRGNSLKYVKSAYIRLSSQLEIIGTYSINKAGSNIGLLIGYFTKTDSNNWYFKPLNKVIPGHIVTDSISSIREIIRRDFPNNDDTSNISEDYYLQNSRLIGKHLHWCGDPHIPPREGWDCPLNGSDKNNCWFCKYGCAVSSYLHSIGKEPNEENIKNCVNNNADMNWGKFGYHYGEKYHDNCFGKIIKSDGHTHFVHIMKVYDDGSCDIFDPNGGRRKGNINEFSSFLIKN